MGGTRDYNEFIAFCQSERYKYQVNDIHLDQFKEHPITFNDMVDGHKVDEVITTVINETGCPIRLDYILFLNEHNRKQLEYKDCIVEKFPSRDKRFPFLSDHYGVESTIIYPN